MRTEAEDDDDDSPRLARLLVWKVAEATEPGLLIGAAELSSEKIKSVLILKHEIGRQFVFVQFSICRSGNTDFTTL